MSDQGSTVEIYGRTYDANNTASIARSQVRVAVRCWLIYTLGSVAQRTTNLPENETTDEPYSALITNEYWAKRPAPDPPLKRPAAAETKLKPPNVRASRSAPVATPLVQTLHQK